MADGASFLPRIESVFYAVFDALQGPKIVHQVPEGLIASQLSTTSNTSSTNFSFSASSSNLATPISSESDTLSSRGSSSVLSSPVTLLDTRPLGSIAQKGASSSTRSLFNFDDVSRYIIPPSALCGRLVKFATRKHRIIGFPVKLGGRYDRNYFYYNLCFVFDRNANLSCYEPVVRKISRVLTSCEEESAFLSAPKNSSAIYAILEQLYEDLNSYSETSIRIDKFNSIDLKIFPFYPNPPPVKDWQVPLALIGLTKRIEPNWDLTIAKICHFIDGTNHVARIARLADCDIDLTRQAISHLLYYQVIMMIDIFQYSNMYTLRKTVQWLGDEPHVREECGPYVTKPEKDPPDWPKLLYLYSRLKPGITVFEWMEEHDVQELGVDARRFTSFGVVKGFLRRVHRWPVLVHDRQVAQPPGPDMAPATVPNHIDNFRMEPDQSRARGRIQDPEPTLASAGAEIAKTSHVRDGLQRRTSAAETSLEQLHKRESQRVGETIPYTRTRGHRSDSTATVTTNYSRRSHHAGLISSGYITQSPPGVVVKMSPDTINSMELVDSENSSGGRSTLGVSRPRFSRSPSAPNSALQAPGPLYPPDLLTFLDGEHHTDELCTRFEVGLPVLEQWLRIVGGGEEERDFGRISIIYR